MRHSLPTLYRHLALLTSFVFLSAPAKAGLGLPDTLIGETPAPAAFPRAAGGKVAPLWHDAADHKGVVRAIADLQADIGRVTSLKPAVTTTRPCAARPVIIGTVGKCAAIDALIASGKLDASDLKGKWESFVITTVSQPVPGMEQALVIAGSDKRGTIYGIYELSEQLGVSPWYCWADVPAKQRRTAYVVPDVSPRASRLLNTAASSSMTRNRHSDHGPAKSSAASTRRCMSTCSS